MSHPVHYVLEGITYQLPGGDSASARGQVAKYWDTRLRLQIAEDVRRHFRWRCPAEVEAFLSDKDLHESGAVSTYEWLQALSLTSGLSPAELEDLLDESEERVNASKAHLRVPGAHLTLAAA